MSKKNEIKKSVRAWCLDYGLNPRTGQRYRGKLNLGELTVIGYMLTKNEFLEIVHAIDKKFILK
jgi:hypothetical protein